jgi:UDP-glucose 4-epimerase
MALYLITGGAGFIGSHLADRLLALGHEVRVIDNLTSGDIKNIPKGAEFIHADIRDSEALGRSFEGISGCFHLAAIASVQRSVEAPRETGDVNLMGTVGVFETACRTGVPVVYASSAAIYGANDDLPLKEQAVPQPLSPYAADKLSNEMYARALGMSRHWPSFGLRFFNVYGPRQNPHSPYSGVVSIFLQKAIDGRDLTIYGDGGQSRDFIHVHDVTRFLVAALDRASTSAPVVNVCTGRSTSVAELARLLVDRYGGRIVHEPERPGDIRRSLGSPDLAARSLGTTAEIPFRDGLRTLFR